MVSSSLLQGVGDHYRTGAVARILGQFGMIDSQLFIGYELDSGTALPRSVL